MSIGQYSFSVACFLMLAGHASADESVVRDPADLPYVSAMLHMNSHETTTSFLEDVGHFDGKIKLTNDTVYAVTMDNSMQIFCGMAAGADSLQPGNVVSLKGKVLMKDNVFVMQTCSLGLATPHEREVHDRINR